MTSEFRLSLDSPVQSQATVEQQKYRESCLRVFNELLNNNMNTDRRIAFEKMRDGKVVSLILRGVGAVTKETNATQTYDLFAIEPTRILKRRTMSIGQISQIKSESVFNKIGETFYLTSDLFGKYDIFIPTETNIKSLQTAIDNSYKVAAEELKISSNLLSNLHI